MGYRLVGFETLHFALIRVENAWHCACYKADILIRVYLQALEGLYVVESQLAQ